VTSSGKTEIYIHLIEACLKKGKQVLYMLPEIALTIQIIQRLKRVFGNRVGVYHSRFNDNERAETWMRASAKGKNRLDIILGARSAVFVPFDQLGLVIIDEEHEGTFKQYMPSPRYHARDAAIMLAMRAGAKVLLGSATPAVESWYNAQQGKYGKVELLERHGGVKLPVVKRVSLKEARKKKEMQGPFTPEMVQSIQTALDKKEQVILFRNRRGYTPMWTCESCGWVPRCDHCDVSLTYHKSTHSLLCHYCGTTYKPHSRCGACGAQKLNMVGFGTEKIEEETELLFPNAKILRMDQDTTRNKNAHQAIIEKFEVGETDILIGTQMVTKGFDFDKVSVVGILQADATLSFPDFRAHEKAFQLFTQVAGRAGRRDKRGEVILQSSDPDHPILEMVEKHAYKEFYTSEINERLKFAYPPFTRLIHLTLRHTDETVVASGAAELAAALRKKIGKRILGPEKPMVARVRNKYLQQLLVKLEKNADTISMKEKIREVVDEFRQFSDYKRVYVDIDVDPM
ncbi:MAG: primosomal protein N', partial [Flavobacteriales bacterium]